MSFFTAADYSKLHSIVFQPDYPGYRPEVVASGGPSQFSVVYFAVPDHQSMLSSKQTVGEWMEERKGRARYVR